MNCELRIIIAVTATLFGIFGASGQQRTVIAGLEGNTEYRTLIDEEAALVRTADSLTAEIASLRRILRTDTLARAATSAAIVRMEERSFEIRSGMARLASRINTIEQEWILAGLLSPVNGDLNASSGLDSAPEGGNGENEGRHSPNLVYSSYFETNLSPEQLAELRRAQDGESDIPRSLERYRNAHREMVALAREYELASTQGHADSIRTRFDALSTALRTLGEQTASRWETIFDSKSYLYNLLADKENSGDLLARLEQGMERLREERPGQTAAPAALTNYMLQKRMLTEYETVLAESLGNSSAVDSLRKVLAALPGPASLDGLEPVVLKERLFLDYSNIKIGGSPYNAGNPIPEVAVWARGIIWRIQVGNFSARQSPSVFRNASPLAVQKGDDGRFRYFAGGFPTDSLAKEAVEQLRKAGFRAPTAVVWMDGVFIDPAADGGTKSYRVEISGAAELSRETREAIAAENTGDIVRGPEVFIVAPLDAAAAVRLRTRLEAISASHPYMAVKLSKISE